MGSCEVLSARSRRILPVMALLLGLGAACGSGGGTSVLMGCLGPVRVTTAAALENMPRRSGAAATATAFTLGAYYYTWWTEPEWQKGWIDNAGTVCAEVTTRSWRETTSPTLVRPGWVLAVNWFGGDSDRALRAGLLLGAQPRPDQLCIHYDIAIRFSLANLSARSVQAGAAPRVPAGHAVHAPDTYMNHPRYFHRWAAGGDDLSVARHLG